MTWTTFRSPSGHLRRKNKKNAASTGSADPPPPTTSESDDEDPQTLEVRIVRGDRGLRHLETDSFAHRSFNVASASRAKMMARIQKRITILLSLQPASSK